MLTEKDFLALQNGSDVRGVAVEGVPGEAVNLTAEAVGRIAASFVAFLAKRTGKKPADLKIAVGHDSRISARELTTAALQAVCGQGSTAYDCGLASTPAMFMSIVMPETKMDGSIMMTASHLPYNRNGMKFFTAAGGLEKADIKELLLGAAAGRAVSAEAVPEKLELISLYAAHLRQKIAAGTGAKDEASALKGMHIVVDAGNGAGGFFATEVLAKLGADTTGSRFLEPDGMFPNHIPNPENKEAMAAIREAVADSRADLGLIFDTDVDRMSAVLDDGKEISRNGLIAMMAAILAPEYPGSTIVTDSVTSDELTVFLEDKLQLKHHRFKRGYKNVINEGIRLNEAGEVSPLAIETSGHGALKENYFLDDGAFLAVKLLIAAKKAQQQGGRLQDMLAGFTEPLESREYRFKIEGTDDFKAYGAEVLQAFESRARAKGIKVAEPSYEGVRLVFADGWALLRMSLHDPKLPLNVEGRKEGTCAAIVQQVEELLAGFTALDMSVLHK